MIKHVGLEQHASGSSVEKLIAREMETSHAYDGRSVFGWEATPDNNVSDEDAARHASRKRSGKAI